MSFILSATKSFLHHAFTHRVRSNSLLTHIYFCAFHIQKTTMFVKILFMCSFHYYVNCCALFEYDLLIVTNRRQSDRWVNRKNRGDKIYVTCVFGGLHVMFTGYIHVWGSLSPVFECFTHRLLPGAYAVFMISELLTAHNL
jgi:hypothetical protein